MRLDKSADRAHARMCTHEPHIHPATVLSLWQVGWDTARIAAMLAAPESRIYNVLAKAREAARASR
jgi:hypothetical protein